MLYENILFGAENNLEKHFNIFKQAQLDICLLTLSIYNKWASVYRSFTIYNNKFTNSEILFIWAHLEPNWPICLLVYSRITTVQIGVINQCVLPPIFFILLEVKVKVTQTCLTLFDPMDCIVPGILQARMLEWVAFPFSRGSSQPRDWTQVSHIADGFFTNWATREAQEQWGG